MVTMGHSIVTMEHIRRLWQEILQLSIDTRYVVASKGYNLELIIS